MSDVYDEKGKPRPEVLKKHFVQEGRIEEDVALRIIGEGTHVHVQYMTLLGVENSYVSLTSLALAAAPVLHSGQQGFLQNPGIGGISPS